MVCITIVLFEVQLQKAPEEQWGSYTSTPLRLPPPVAVARPPSQEVHFNN